MVKRQIVLITLVLLSSFNPSCGQTFSGLEEVYSFGVRADNPVKMNVTRTGEKVSFKAENHSFLPYDLTINFKTLQNLSPQVIQRKFTAYPGFNNLFDLTVTDKTQSMAFEYSVNFSIGLHSDPELSFPYLLPIGKKRNVQLISVKKQEKEVFLLDQFRMNPGDTVFAARKGIVTALPGNSTRTDRVYKSSSLEVLHADRTLAVYEGLAPAGTKLNLGQTIYPGQPIGLVDEKGALRLLVLTMNNSESMKSIEIYYSDKNGSPISSKMIKDMKVSWPTEVIEKEMTSRELKNFMKGKLY